MAALWTAADAAAATGGSSVTQWTATGVSIDTRSLVAGDLFVALRGPNHDGHDFVAAALQRGAAAAMVYREIPQLPASSPLLVVADTLAGLAALGAAGRNRSVSSDRCRHWQRRQDRDEGGVAPGARQLPPDLCLGRRAQQSLGRAFIARPFAAGSWLRGIRAWHEPSRRDREPYPAGEPAYRGDHDGGAGASRLLSVGRGDCRCQGRDLSRPRTGRHRSSQPRQPALRKSDCGRKGCRRRRDPRLWGPSGSRRAPGRLRARFARQHCRGGGLRRDTQVSGAGPGPALGHERTRSAGCSASRRRVGRSRRRGLGRTWNRCRAAAGATNSLGAAER